MIPIYKPYLTKDCLKYAHDALDSGWISSQGKYIQMATEKLQELLNVKYVQLLNNGTSACHLMAKSIVYKYNINEIIVPNNSYVAAWNAFMFDFNFNLFTVECNLNTWNYDLVKLGEAIKNHPLAAVLIVHNIGSIINVKELKRKYPNTIFIEDNCEGFLGSYEDKQSGTESYASAISFFGNKNISSGEGGAFLTNDEDVYLHMKCVQGQGQSKKRFVHDMLGYNFRITNIQSAILYGQLEILPEILYKKNIIFNTYREAFKDRQNILLQMDEPNTQHSNWMFGVRIPNQKKYEIAELFFKNKGIETRQMFFPITEHKYLINNSNIHISDCTNADLLNNQCLILPSFPEITNEEQIHIINTTEEYLKEIK